MRLVQKQYSFTAGQLDPSLAARSDVQAYYNGGKVLNNVVALPTGGVKTRSGTSYLDEIAEAANGVKLAKFVYDSDERYLIVICHEKIIIYREGDRVAEIDSPYTADDLDYLKWTFSGDTMIFAHGDYAPRRLMRQGSDADWLFEVLTIENIPQYDFDGDDVKEDVWSDARGWPRSVYFYESRMLFGGSESRPQTVWGSRSGEYFDFGIEDEEDLVDDDAIEVTLDNDQVASIQQISSLKDLFVFTDGGVFAQTNTPVTPSNFMLSRQTNIPSAPLKPVEIDGSLVFVRDGSDGSFMSVHEMNWDDGYQVYGTNEVSLLAGDILNNPKGIASRLGNKENSANHLFLLNEDGEIAAFHTKRNQEIAGWTLLDFTDEVVAMETVGPILFLILKRNINGTAKYYLEWLDGSKRLDCSLVVEVDDEVDTWAGLNHLEGAEVTLILDESPIGTATVEDGAITTPYAGNKLEAGFNFDWQIETMPVDTRLGQGGMSGDRHRPVRASVNLKDSWPIKINSKQITFDSFESQTFDSTPETFTGSKQVRMAGYRGNGVDGATVKIDGVGSLPSTILGIELEVAA